MSSLSDSAKDNTAIVLVPGSFTPTLYYTYVSRTLLDHGFAEVRGCPLLSACPADDQRMPPAKFEDDSFYIREVLEALLNKGKDVIMVMNSYGGFPGTEALRDLPSRGSLASEQKEGQRGAVVGLIYLCSFLPLPGDSLRSVMGDYLFEPLKSGDTGKYMHLAAEAGPGIFSDWAAEGEKREEDVKYWFGNAVTHSSDSFDGKVSHDIWSEGSFSGKIVYLAGGNDLIVPGGLLDDMLKKIEGTPGGKKVEVKRIEDGGHVMHVTKPDIVVQTIEDLVGSLAK